MFSILGLLVYLATTAAAVTGVHLVSARHNRPTYENSVLAGKRIFWISATISAVSGIALSVIHAFYGVHYFSAMSVALLSTIVYLLSLYTYSDHKLRKADRVPLYYGTLLTIVLGIVYFIIRTDETTMVSFLVALALSAIVLFVPVIGASDARTLMFITPAMVLTLGPVLTYYSLIVSFGCILLYGIVGIIRKRTMKVSIPLVPYLLLPAPFFIFYESLVGLAVA